ncbi:MAG: hypothetical protein CSA33_03825 [Desulfobulbus propionicus]|nr:MAG: hypothetical protein CSA33_03825 [Desulfobulbus propionicus]
MSTDLFSLATYAGPPVIGAFIGYLTNKVAIRMLFRPLNPWHVFGIRVPMTPGVIPSQRYRLADNIGEMVGNHLLTSTEIGAALSTETFQHHLQTIIGSHLEEVLDTEFDSLASSLSQQHKDIVEQAVARFSEQAAIRLSTYFRTPEWATALENGLAELADKTTHVSVSDCVDRKSRATLYAALAQVIKPALCSAETEEQVGRFVAQWFGEAVRTGKTLNAVCPDEIIRLLHQAVEEQAPNLLDLLGRQLTTPEIRQKIVQGVLGAVDHFIESLGPMGAMAKGFIDADTLERSIDAYLQGKEEEMLSWLQEPQLVEKATKALHRQVDSFLGQSFSQLYQQLGAQGLDKVCRALARAILAPFTYQREVAPLESFIEEVCESFLQEGALTVDQLLGKSSSSDKEHGFSLQAILLAWSRSDTIEKVLRQLINTSGRRLLEVRIGKLSPMVHASFQQAMAEYAIVALNRIFLKEVPGLVQSLQISTLVTEKINTLDLLKLEKLLLSIMEEQFKYINLFGALLGFVIGLMNLFILHLK